MAGELMYSKGQIDRTGRTLHRAMTGDEPPPSVDEVVEATIVVDAFRRAHGTPMSSEAVHDWLRMLSQSHAFDEAGVVADSEFERDYTDKRMRAWTHITSSLEGRVRRHG